MAIHNGKFFDVEVTRAFFTDLADGYNEFNRNAKIHRGTLEDFVNTDAWQGKDAENAKKLMKANKITLLNEVLDLQAEATKLSEHILDKFRIEVDNAPDARIEYDTLWQINDDYKNLYFDYMDIHNDVESIASDSQLRFSRYGNIRIPESTNCEKAFAKLCGSDDDNAGFIYECIQKLIRFDSETEALINDAALGSKAEFLLNRMRTKDSAVNVGRLSSKSDFASGFDISDVRFGRRIVSARFNGRFLRNRFKDVIYIDDEQVPLRGGKRFSKSLRGMFTKSATKSTSKTKSKAKTSTKATKQTQVQSVDYSVYETGVNAVDAYIPQVISDLESANNDELMRDYWATADENKRKAIAAVFNYDMAFIDGHLSNAKCEKQEIHVNSIFKMMVNSPESQYMEGNNGGYVYEKDGAGSKYPTSTYYFNTAYMNELKEKCGSQNAKKYIDLLIPLTKKGDCPGYYDIDVKLAGAAVSINITSTNGSVKEVFYQPDDRIRWAVDYWEKRGDYNYTKEIIPELNVIELYKRAKSGDDARFIDKLLRADREYTDVFTGSTTHINGDIAEFVGDYMIALADEKYNSERYKEYVAFVDSALNAAYKHDGVYISRRDENLDFLLLASGMAADFFRGLAWTVDLNDVNSCANLKQKIEIANQNEMLIFGLKTWNEKAGTNKKITGINFAEDKNESFDFQNKGKVIIEYTDYGMQDSLTGYNVPAAQVDYTARDSFTVYEYAGLPAVNSYCTDKYKREKERRLKAEKKILLDTTVSIMGIVFPELKTTFNALKKISNQLASGNYTGAFLAPICNEQSDASDLNKFSASMFDFVTACDSESRKHSEEIAGIDDLEKLSTFYSRLTIDTPNDNGIDSYKTLLNFDAIKLIRTWDMYGISCLYSYEDEDGNHNRSNDIENGYYDYFCNDKDTLIKDALKKCSSTSEEIEKAVNTIIFGAAKTGTTMQRYETINDIPIDVLSACLNMLDGVAPRDRQGETIENVQDISQVLGNTPGFIMGED
jgi:hypothetical protein